jgi:uncharacterized iron-regulated membrane protein
VNFLRKAHLIVGAVCAPFLLVTGATAFVMLSGIRHNALAFFPLHSWRVIQKYAGVVVAAGLVLLAISGGILYANWRIGQFKRRAKARAAAKAKA